MKFQEVNGRVFYFIWAKVFIRTSSLSNDNSISNHWGCVSFIN